MGQPDHQSRHPWGAGPFLWFMHLDPEPEKEMGTLGTVWACNVHVNTHLCVFACHTVPRCKSKVQLHFAPQLCALAATATANALQTCTANALQTCTANALQTCTADLRCRLSLFVHRCCRTFTTASNSTDPAMALFPPTSRSVAMHPGCAGEVLGLGGSAASPA